MTATEKFKRAESLFQDKTKRELAEMVVHREGDLEDARADNAKLREERREYQATIDSLVDECADHKAENAKLRELLSESFLLMHHGGLTT